MGKCQGKDSGKRHELQVTWNKFSERQSWSAISVPSRHHCNLRVYCFKSQPRYNFKDLLASAYEVTPDAGAIQLISSSSELPSTATPYPDYHGNPFFGIEAIDFPSFSASCLRTRTPYR